MSKHPNLKPWKPGQSGNPSGNAPIPAPLRGIASLSQHEVTKVVSKYARMTRAELQAAAQSQDTPMLEVAIASIFAQSAKNGDYARLAFLLDRAIGKVPTVEIEADQASSPFAALSDEELLRLVRGGEKPKELEAG